MGADQFTMSDGGCRRNVPWVGALKGGVVERARTSTSETKLGFGWDMNIHWELTNPVFAKTANGATTSRHDQMGVSARRSLTKFSTLDKDRKSVV